MGEAIAQGLERVALNFSLRVGAGAAVGGSGATTGGRSGGGGARGFAHGGRFDPYEPIVVGEHRREVVEFDRGGVVHPSVADYLGSVTRPAEGSSVSGGFTWTGNVTVDARGATDPEAVGYATRRAVSRELETFERGMPGRRVI